MKECVNCGKQTNSCVASDCGWLCYQCFDKHKPTKHEPEKKTGSRRNSHDEDDIQAEFFRTVPLFLPNIPEKLLYAVPNGGKREQKTIQTKTGTKTFSPEAVRLKRQGVKSGVADVILQIPKNGYGCLCMEFKTDSGDQSAEQKEFQKQTESVGNKYVIVRSAMQAIEELKEYLK